MPNPFFLCNMSFQSISCDETRNIIYRVPFDTQLSLRLVDKECNRLVISCIKDTYSTDLLALMQALRFCPGSNRLPTKWLIMYAYSSSGICTQSIFRYKCARCHMPVQYIGSCHNCSCELDCLSFPLGRVTYGPLVATAVIFTAMVLLHLQDGVSFVGKFSFKK